MQNRLSTLIKPVLVTVLFCVTLLFSPKAYAQEYFVGEIRAFAFDFVPSGWAKCEGQLLQISQYSALFSLIGTAYGGDGRTTFGLPDLRGRVAISQGSGLGLTNRNIGTKGGEEVVALNTLEMPSHTHAALINVNSATGNQTSPTNHFFASDPREKQYSSTVSNKTMNASSVTVQSQGGSQPHQNMQPYLTVNYCIALTGIFPSVD